MRSLCQLGMKHNSRAYESVGSLLALTQSLLEKHDQSAGLSTKPLFIFYRFSESYIILRKRQGVIVVIV